MSDFNMWLVMVETLIAKQRREALGTTVSANPQMPTFDFAECCALMINTIREQQRDIDFLEKRIRSTGAHIDPLA